MITLTINGQPRNLPALADVAALLAHLELTADRVVVEHNGTILNAEQHAAPVQDGDRLEIIQFVGGG